MNKNKGSFLNIFISLMIVNKFEYEFNKIY